MTNDYQIIEIPADFRFRAGSSLNQSNLADAVNERVETIWQRETQRNPYLFNGQLLSLLSYDAHTLVGSFVEYKYHLAQLREPELAAILAITPVCVSAMIHTDTAALIGKRSQTVLQYPSYYELVPSGGVDAESMKGKDEIDICDLALRELEEEAGINKEMVLTISPRALVNDRRDKILEIYVEIRVAKEVACAKITPASHEHTELLWVAKSDLPNFIEQHRENFLPLSRHLINRYFWCGLRIS